MPHPTIDATWYEKPARIKETTAAGGIIVRQQENQVLVALIREGTLPAYVLPKGRVEPGEAVENTARREIEEEAGFTDLQLLGPLAVLERLDYAKRHWKITHYFLFVTNQIQSTPTDPKMVYQVEWFPLEALPPLFWPEQKSLLETSRADILAALGR
ncbi:MAG: NUDIX hydrolase [Cyanobacteria bacterium Co-bin13]|nr:NUDIX hydrolase [Cyanobacteria bacterium Co-bin13]